MLQRAFHLSELAGRIDKSADGTRQFCRTEREILMDELVVLPKQGQFSQTELSRSVCGMDDSVGQFRQTGKRPYFPTYEVPQFFCKPNLTLFFWTGNFFIASCISKMLRAVIGFAVNLAWHMILQTWGRCNWSYQFTKRSNETLTEMKVVSI